MLELPLEAMVNQEFLVTLGEQDCTIALYQRGASMYLDLNAGGAIICRGAICQPGMGIVQRATMAFAGQLYLLDERSQPMEQQPPQWQGLGTRWKLYWLSPEEVKEINAANLKAALNG
ncbi:MAG: hypothetical protein HDR50_06905 [Desulfovibrio sp.]|uniref:phage baseplate plug family protein n=1 Tax=Desulfovibrio sp. TaxID=885 RepID=UPI001A66110D|nr:hypothetical protein [Desulfovibrio sp.]MBD5417377.1 hypothetical protein [Desulfovibrio sp.]